MWYGMLERGERMVGMSRATLSKLNNDNYVALEVLDRICAELDCPIEAVVKIEKDPDESGH